MKNSILSVVTAILLVFTASVNVTANEKTEKKAVETISAEEIAEAKADINKMVDRVMEINEMNVDALSKSERKELRKEVRSIKKDLRAYSKSDSPAVAEAAAKGAQGTGIYISGGALIVILLLILLL
ncbi:MAG: hypothetical protein ACOC11_00080 [Prolixibacteraceae bacterium]